MASNSTKGKIIKLSKGLSTLFKVISILAFVCCVFSLILFISGFFFPYDEIKDAFLTLIEKTESNGAPDLSYFNINDFEVMMAGSLLSSLGGMFLMNYLYKLFNTIKVEETPFSEKTVMYLNRIAIMSLINGICIPAIMGIIILVVPTVSSYNFGLSGTEIILSLVILGLSLVFRYGVELQKEADTTL